MTHVKILARLGLISSAVFFLITSGIQAQHSPQAPEEILLELNVERELTFDFSAIIADEVLYLPASRLFALLGNEYKFKEGQLILEVRIADSDTHIELNFEKFKVDGARSDVSFTERDFLVRREEVYLNKTLLENLFGYTIIFDFRKLEIMLFSKQELQVIKRNRQKEKYRNFENEGFSLNPEVREEKDRHLLNGGVMDWSVNSTHSLHNKNFTYAGGVGAEVLGGDLTGRLSGSKEYGIHWHNSRVKWRYPIYSTPVLTQFSAGVQSVEDKIGGRHLLYNGIEITNRPLSSRRYFNQFTIANSLNPGWDAGLEVNGRLRDVALSEETEKYNFTVPLSYGSNAVTINQFDENGYNHPEQYRVYIPHHILPPNEFEYDLTFGRYIHTENDFAKLNLKWGLSPHITLGGGSQYVTSSRNSLTDGKVVPFFQMWSRLNNSISLEGSHSLDYLTSASMKIFFPNAQVLRFNLEKYHKPTVLNRTGKSLDASMVGSFPISLPFLRLNATFSASYIQYKPSSGFMNIYGGLNAMLPSGFRLYINSRGQFNNWDYNTFPTPQSHETQFSISKRVLRKLLLRSGTTYSHSRDEFLRSRFEVIGRIFKDGNLGLLIDHDHLFNRTSVQLNFSFDFPFARHSSQFRSNYNNPSINQRTSGTIAFNKQNNQFYFDRRDWSQKAAITLQPFLDLNNNSRQDPGEISVSGLKASVYRKGNSRPTYRDHSTITKLTAYDSYIVQIKPESLSNPLWAPKHEVYEVQPGPNKFTVVHVPIMVLGEASGHIDIEEDNTSVNLYGIDIKITSADQSFSEITQTYTGGDFFYVGLKPGHYTASLNRDQLLERSMEAVKDSIDFVINFSTDGDIVEGLELTVRNKQIEKNMAPVEKEVKNPSEKEANTSETVVNSDQEDVNQAKKIYNGNLRKGFTIQVGAFQHKDNAERHAAFIKPLIGRDIRIIHDSTPGLYRCIVKPFNEKNQAIELLNHLKVKYRRELPGAFLIKLN